jgi:predicted regulator of Ras-like GTPase activity (Roadblock/LC7/MglB family)
MMLHQQSLDGLTAIPGVRGAMLTNRSDGIVVAESIMEDVESAALAALASSLARRLEQAAMTARAGESGFLHLQASGGALFVAPAGPELLLVVIADRGINVGRARLEMTRVAEALA